MGADDAVFCSVPEAIEDLKAGRFIIMVDDCDRENEGDLVCAAELVTPPMINFMIRQAAGKLCLVGIRDISDAGDGRALVLPKWVAAAAIGKDLVVSFGFVLVRLAAGRTFIHPRLIGKSCTVVQLALVCSVLLWLDLPVWLSGLPKVLWCLATGLAVAAALDYVRAGTQYVAGVAAEQRPPPDERNANGRR